MASAVIVPARKPRLTALIISRVTSSFAGCTRTTSSRCYERLGMKSAKPSAASASAQAASQPQTSPPAMATTRENLKRRGNRLLTVVQRWTMMFTRGKRWGSLLSEADYRRRARRMAEQSELFK